MKKRLNHNQVHPNRKRVKKVSLDCPSRCEGCGKTCEFDQMNWDGGDNHLCGGCMYAVNEAVKSYVCKGCGKKHAPGVVWVWDDWCEDCEHKTFNGDDDDDFQSCGDCDLPDACRDFGCAIK